MTSTPQTAAGVAAPPAARPALSPSRLAEGRRVLAEKTDAVRLAEERLRAARAAQTRQMRLWRVRGMSFDDLATLTGMTRQGVYKRFKS